MGIKEELAEKFKCPKCQTKGGIPNNLAATGTGFSKFFDVQNRRFITISCSHCGYTELYNMNILEGKDSFSDILDFIFGS